MVTPQNSFISVGGECRWAFLSFLHNSQTISNLPAVFWYKNKNSSSNAVEIFKNTSNFEMISYIVCMYTYTCIYAVCIYTHTYTVYVCIHVCVCVFVYFIKIKSKAKYL